MNLSPRAKRMGAYRMLLDSRQRGNDDTSPTKNDRLALRERGAQPIDSSNWLWLSSRVYGAPALHPFFSHRACTRNVFRDLSDEPRHRDIRIRHRDRHAHRRVARRVLGDR